ncbi:MAG: hypothetical protein ACPH5G_06300 [Pseudooceanicola atlanticus]
MFDRLTATCGQGSAIAKLAPDLHWNLMLRTGDHEYAIRIENGVVIAANAGPHVMPSWQTRLAAQPEEWAAFFESVPRPGHHDIIALLRRGAIRFEGDLHTLMANLYYTKRMLASLRPEVAT